MKIRTDFVTNSSSSSFCAVVGIQTKDGKNYTFYDEPFDDPESIACIEEIGGYDCSCRWNGKLKEKRS